MTDTLEALNLITRQDAIAQSGLSSGRLSRLDKSSTVVPQKYGSKEHPAVLYTPLQVRALRLIAKTKNTLTSAEIKVMLNSFLYYLECDYPIVEEWLLLADGKAHFIRQDQIGGLIDLLCSKGKAIEMKIVRLQNDGNQ